MTSSSREGRTSSPSNRTEPTIDIPALRPKVPTPPLLQWFSLRLPAYALVLFFGLLQLFYTMQTGLWEPSETDRALLALSLRAGEMHWIAPVVDGALQPIPWLDLILLNFTGNNEALLRLPFLCIHLLGLVVLANIAAQHFGRWVAMFAVALAAGTPALLFGGTSLAGMGATSAVLGMATLSVAHFSTVPEKHGVLRGFVLGALFGLSYLAWGVLGAAIPVGMGLVLSWTRGVIAPSISTIMTSVLVAFAIAAVPTLPLIQALGVETALPYILWPELMSNAEPESFDRLLRILGFSTYPLLALAPFSIPWLSSRMKDEEHDFHTSSTLFVLALLIACAVTLISVGVANAFSPTPLLPLTHVLALLVAVSVSGLWRKNIRRSASYITLLTSLLLFLILAKDLSGAWNEDEGRPGPYLLFEPILRASEHFSPAGTLPGIHLAPLLMGLLLLVGYSDIPSRFRDLQKLIEARSESSVQWSRVYRVLEALRRASFALMQQVTVSRIAVGIGALMVLQGILMLHTILPTYAHSHTNQGLAHTLLAVRQADEAVYHLDDHTVSRSFYLQGIETWAVPDMRTLERHVCQATSRVFAVLNREQTTRFIATMRRAALRQANDCPNAANIFLLLDKGAPLILISNEYHPDRGETISPRYANLFVDDRSDLPPDLVRPENPYLVGQSLELLGARAIPITRTRQRDIVIESYWYVRRVPLQDWHMLMHVDAGEYRKNEDHPAFEGLMPLTRLTIGDILVDRHTVSMHSLKDRRGDYRVFVGFYHDDDRQTVVPPVPFERIPLLSFPFER